THWAVVLAAAAFLVDGSSPSRAQQIVIPQPIPPQFNFPQPAATINAWIAASNETAIRGHAWELWAGLTANSNQMVGGVDLPIWETWLGNEDVFPQNQITSAASVMARAAARPRTLRAFVSPNQFHHDRQKADAAARGADPSVQVVSFNKFDPSAAMFIAAPQSGPGGQNFSYNRQSSLQMLNSAWPAGTSGQNRAANEFPIEAIELKPVFRYVKARGLTPQPLWMGPE